MTIDGKKIADKSLQDLKTRLEQLPFQPVLCDVLVGDDPVSLSYVNIKEKTALSVGLGFNLVQLPDDASTSAIITAINEVQQDPNLFGLIVQLPLPDVVDKDAVLGAIDLKVDVDLISPRASEM